jgi:acetolactate synthase-1/2/3 large subunit
MDPEQEFIPKVKGIKKQDNSIFAPPIEEMSPLLSFSEIEENILAFTLKRKKYG